MSESVKNEWIDSMLFLMRSNGTSEKNDDACKMYLALEELLERRKCDEEPWNGGIDCEYISGREVSCMEKGNNDVVVKVSAENMEKLFDVLAKSAFDALGKGQVSWGSYHSDNPFYNIVKEVFKENEAEIKKEIGDILMGVVTSDGFRDAIKVEYTALLADSMMNQICKR